MYTLRAQSPFFKYTTLFFVLHFSSSAWVSWKRLQFFPWLYFFETECRKPKLTHRQKWNLTLFGRAIFFVIVITWTNKQSFLVFFKITSWANLVVFLSLVNSDFIKFLLLEASRVWSLLKWEKGLFFPGGIILRIWMLDIYKTICYSNKTVYRNVLLDPSLPFFISLSDVDIWESKEHRKKIWKK